MVLPSGNLGTIKDIKTQFISDMKSAAQFWLQRVINFQ